MSEEFVYDVFISYSRKDSEWVEHELLTRLEAAGLKVCIDVRDFRPGAPTVSEIERAILSSRHTLLVLTPAYLASQWTEFETLMLQTLDPPNQQRRLLPLLKAPCDLPLRIRFLTYLDLSEPSLAACAWPRLLSALAAPVNLPTPPPIMPPGPAQRDKLTILFVAADPSDRARLRTSAEFREIQERLKAGRYRDRLQLQLPQLAVRPADISQALLDYEPQLVHFSGHGDESGALIFESASGSSQAVSSAALAALFAQFANQIECVLLNGCFTAPQADAICLHIRYVIGTSHAISDPAAIAFSLGFYQALAAGKSIPEAFAMGKVQIGLQGYEESDTPILVEKQA